MIADDRRRQEVEALRRLAASERAVERAHGEEASASVLPNYGLGHISGPSWGGRLASSTRPIASRPLRPSIRIAAKDGTIPFHMGISCVSKTAPADRGGHSGVTSAAAHQRYIERTQALEAPECDDIPTTSVAQSTQRYIERDGAAFGSFGTIGDSIEDRIAFWGAVEASERTPRRRRMSLALDDEPTIVAIAGRIASDAPRALMRLLVDRAPVMVDTETMHAITAYCREHDLIGLATFDDGRGGVVQRRLVLELPADMTATDRHRIAARFCELAFEARGVRYHCAIHAPTPENDLRNFHMHIVFYDRPASRVRHPETGKQVWDFEVVEAYKTTSYNVRFRRSLQGDVPGSGVGAPIFGGVRSGLRPPRRAA